MSRKEQKENIIRAIEASEYKWRTIRGIVKDSKVPLQQVEKIVKRSDEIVKARKPNSHGQALFTTRKKLKKESSAFQRLAAKIINSASFE